MATFIINQILVEKTAYVGSASTVSLQVVVRRVEAENQEEAIGKFVLATDEIKAERKLKIECIPYENLAAIE